MWRETCALAKRQGKFSDTGMRGIGGGEGQRKGNCFAQWELEDEERVEKAGEEDVARAGGGDFAHDGRREARD